MDGFLQNIATEMISEVYNEDCNIGMKRFPDGFFDLAICDIPYGINAGKMAFLKEKKTTIKQKNGNRLNPHSNKNYQLKEWDLKTPDQSYFDELVRVSKHQIIFGVEYVNWQGLGSGRIKWNKGVPDGVSFKGYEMAYCSLIDHEVEVELLWAGMNQAKSLREPMVQQGNKKLNEKRIHPCHKPILLYQKLLLDYGFGSKILDTHLGSGSHRIAAYEMGFDFYAWELDKDYFEASVKRFETFKSQLNMFRSDAMIK